MLLSLDLANETGYAIFDGGIRAYSGTITAEGSTKYRKIKSMKDKLEKLVQTFKIDEVAIEDIQLQKIVVGGRKIDGVKSYRALAEMRGAVIVMLVENGVKEKKIKSYTPSEWRAVHKIKQGRGVKRDEIKADVTAKYGPLFENASIDELEAILIGLAHIKINSKEG